MSLINDALKKAQRQRNDNPQGLVPPMPGGGGGGGRVAKRGAPMASQTVVMIVAGCVVLVVLSGVGAVLFVNGKSKPKPEPATTVAAAPAATTPPATTPPDASVPKIEFPITFAPVPPSPPREENTGPDRATKVPPSAVVEGKSSPKAPAAPDASGSTAKTVEKPPVGAPRAAPDERVYVFLDALRIGGIRSSGGDSRVLMNEHVYRVNDVVDRGLGLKLTIVSSDFLTFTDSNGVDYVKNF